MERQDAHLNALRLAEKAEIKKFTAAGNALILAIVGTISVSVLKDQADGTIGLIKLAVAETGTIAAFVVFFFRSRSWRRFS